jgi:hypothetical protein
MPEYAEDLQILRLIEVKTFRVNAHSMTNGKAMRFHHRLGPDNRTPAMTGCRAL